MDLERELRAFEDIVLPSTESWIEQEGKKLVSSMPQFTIEECLRMQYLYKYAFELFLLSQTGLDRLDDRLFNEGWRPVPVGKQDYYQLYDTMPLRFFYLRSTVHIERLDDNELYILSDAGSAETEEKIQSVLELVSATYKKVMEADPDNPELEIMLFDSLDHSGIVLGKSILMGISSFPKEELPNTRSTEEGEYEHHRYDVFYSVADQLQPILSKVLDLDVRFIVNV